ncbi:TetR/AcrR family transcriptional regulator [uncultured Ferrimonas sp.]|uniref:TetR/AcrR family transcriptional regulator n=1 Tax=uncultured Ferrimonas sp. TaxID=432640 RepID=UPI002607394B|nr:TetR/AcrR family transcriptional regulator [uncultured Ferrimonas sp.]
MACDCDSIHRSSQILDVVERHIDSYGLFSFTVSEVIAESNQSTTTFYKRFKGKEDLLVCVFLRNATSNHFKAFEAQYPNQTPIERFLLPIVLSFEVGHKSPAFNLVRQVAVNSRVWRLAAEPKVSLFRHKIAAFWNYIETSVRNLVASGDLVASEEAIINLTQSVTFYLSGSLNAMECGLINDKFIGQQRDKVFQQLKQILNAYQWNTEISFNQFEKVGFRCYLYLNGCNDDKCQYCLRCA